jgi:hypothetical protein
MSRYSFIDDNINLTGKQCFCIDVNSTNSPFIIGGNQTIQPEPSLRSQSPLRPQSPSSPKKPSGPDSSPRPHSPLRLHSSLRLSSPQSSPRPHSPLRLSSPQSPIQTINVSAPTSVPPESLIRGYETRKSKNENLGQDYLLTPEVINSNIKEQQVIKKVNTLLNEVYSNVQKDILGANAAVIDISKTSMTSMPVDNTKSKIDLNTMANDKFVGKKALRKSSSNLNLFEGFEQSGCTDVCKPKKYSNRNTRRYKKTKSNENTYLLIAIILLLLFSWFKK